MNTLYLPPYLYPIRVFTSKEECLRYVHKNKIAEYFDKGGIASDYSTSEVFDTEDIHHIGREIIMLLPPMGEDGFTMDLEEAIDHEVIHAVFRILDWVGSTIGSAYGSHEHFIWHVNYLDRQIKNKVYKIK